MKTRKKIVIRTKDKLRKETFNMRGLFRLFEYQFSRGKVKLMYSENCRDLIEFKARFFGARRESIGVDDYVYLVCNPRGEIIYNSLSNNILN